MSTEKVRFNLEVSKVRLSSTISVSPIYRSPGSSRTSVIHSVGSCAKPFNWFTEKLDTAASRCLLNKPTVRWLFPWHAIQPGTVEVYCYGNTKIGTAGTVSSLLRLPGPACIHLVSPKQHQRVSTDDRCITCWFELTTDLIPQSVSVKSDDGHCWIYQVTITVEWEVIVLPCYV